jgi:hypothetical protein
VKLRQQLNYKENSKHDIGIEETPFTLYNKERDTVTHKSDRPALIVSSTSWTPGIIILYGIICHLYSYFII